MPTYKIRGIDVDFPYEAYDCQIVYMEKVIQSLQENCNALLESPTGTGKTLCLLCAALAWRKSLGGFSMGKRAWKLSDVSQSQSDGSNLPAIIYTSRTHSQLRQVIQELKRTSYRPKMTILGSREQLCIHEDVSLLHGKAQNNACRSLRRNRKKCVHYTRVAEFMKGNSQLGEEPIDIEDLVNIGKGCGVCPYYVSKEIHKDADILFGPYNYVIDHGYRDSLSFNWNNSVLIFDEAHNLEGLSEDAASFDLPSWLLLACISEAQKCVDLSVSRRQVDRSNDKLHNPDNFAILKALLLKLQKRISQVPLESKELGFTRSGPYIYELLDDLNITNDTASKLIGIVDEAVILLQEGETETESGRTKKARNTTCRLEVLGDILRKVFRNNTKDHAKYYRVHVQEVEANAVDALNGEKASRTLSWWCFNPGIAMEEFLRLGVGSVILTSGTLSPLDSFAQELKLEFPVRLENPHVICSSQIWAGVVSAGPSRYTFNSSYRNRDSIEYKQELGNAIVNFARIVPDGLLVFFPSYYLLDQCIGCWKNISHSNSTNSSTVWERICKLKQPVVEPRQSSLFLLSIEDYMKKLKDTSSSGAVFFAVCRGKVSEGLDFADHAGRAVVVTGMPFAMRTDPKVRLKREYLDQQAQSKQTECKALTGEEWYNQQASRAVNQAVGRVIRHRHDYGAIIFCDERFAHSNRQSQVSSWIQPHIKCYSTFGDVVFTLTRFFREGGIRVAPMLKSPLSKNSAELNQTLITKLPLIEGKVEPPSSDLPSLGPYGKINDITNAQSVDESYLEKILMVQNTAMDLLCRNDKSLSSVLEVKRGTTTQRKEIVPANRSSLVPIMKKQDLKLNIEKNMLIPGRKNSMYQRCEVIDLTNSPLMEEKPSAEVVVLCSSKRPRISKIEPDALPSNVVPCGADETRGSAFLMEVQEKLSASEYKEFVGFMKALKSKAMKIGHVLQSIARLFSAPERLHLLTRFKDYLPGKYHSIYEQHLERTDEKIDSLIDRDG